MSPATEDLRSSPTLERPLEGVFELELGRVLGELSGRLRVIVGELPGTIRHAADLRRVLDLDTKVSTQVYRVAMGEAPEGNAAHVPGPPSMGRFLVAARHAGASEGAVRAADLAYAGFLALVERSAGDRTTFDSMVWHLGAAVGQEAGLALDHRKKAFRAMSHLIGMQAETLQRCAILYLAENGKYDYAQLRMFGGIRKLTRSGSVLLYRSSTSRRGEGPAPFAPVRGPIDPGAPHERGTNVFPEFSSKPLPEIRVVDGETPQAYKTQLVSHTLGNPGLTDLAFGHVDRGGFGPGENTSMVESHAGIYFPTARLVHDLILPASEAPYEISSQVYANLYEVELMSSEPERETLPVGGAVRAVSDGPRGLADKADVNYERFVQHTLECLGIAGRKVQVFRHIVEYPVLHSLNVLRASGKF